jgi:hypothetical protein
VADTTERLEALWNEWGLPGEAPIGVTEASTVLLFVIRDGPCLHTIDGIEIAGSIAELAWGAKQTPSCEESIGDAAYAVAVERGQLPSGVELRISSPVTEVPVVDPEGVHEPIIVTLTIE